MAKGWIFLGTAKTWRCCQTQLEDLVIERMGGSLGLREPLGFEFEPWVGHTDGTFWYPHKTWGCSSLDQFLAAKDT